MPGIERGDLLKKTILPLMMVFIILSVPSVYADNSFIRETYGDASGTPFTAYGVSQKIYENPSCGLTESGAFTGTTATPYNISYIFHAPHSNSQITGTLSGVENVNCLNLGGLSGITDTNNTVWETSITVTHGATATNAGFIKSSLNCTTSLNRVTVGNNGEKDSQGNLVNLYGNTSSGNEGDFSALVASLTPIERIIWQNFYTDKELSDCVIADPAISRTVGGLASNGYACTIEILPFNSGGDGFANIKIQPPNASVTGGTPFSGVHVEYFPPDSPAEAVTVTTNVNWIAGNGAFTGLNIDQNVTLTPERDYVLLSYYCGLGSAAGASSITYTRPSYNVSYSVYVPDFVCTDWSECISGFQTRTCVDSNDIAIPKIENRVCSLVSVENATLGFEESETVSDVKKCIPTWGIGCVHQITSISVERPINWTVLDPSAANKQYFLAMTQDWASEGTRSLKIWYIPPSEQEPSGGVCTNLTVGRIPQILQNLSNSTFATIHNVTFPATNMLFSFDVKGCADQVLKNAETRTLFDLILICPDACYSANCSTVPNHRYFFNIVDTTDDTSLLGSPYFGSADTNLAETISIDLSNLGVVAGRDYTVVFAVFPENLNDRVGECVMFDNVRYDTLENPLETLVPDCESLCIGDDFYNARILPNGQCSVIIEEFSPSCTDRAKAEAIDNLEDYCIDSTSAAIFNTKSAKYTQIICDFACSDGRCVTEEEAAISEAEDTRNDSLLDDIFDFGIFNIFFTPFAVGAYAVILFSAVAGALTKHWEIGAVTGLVMLVVVTFGGLWPIEAAFLVGAGIAVILGNQGKNKMGSG